MNAASTVHFTDPEGNRKLISAALEVRRIFDESRKDYWRRGNGGGLFEFSGGVRHALLVFPATDYGVYLKWHELDVSGKHLETWLSAGNLEDLATVVDCADEWWCSRGLFVPREKAWMAVEAFIGSGERSKVIQWLKPEEIPEGGNW